MKIGEVLKDHREERGLSVIEVAKQLGIDRTTYFRYENGEVKNIPNDKLFKLISLLEIDVKEII